MSASGPELVLFFEIQNYSFYHMTLPLGVKTKSYLIYSRK